MINIPVIGILVFLLMLSGKVYAQQLAFPGAEGFAKYVSGGRGGHIVAVTNLLDDPANPPEGSMRWAVKQGMDTIIHPISGDKYAKPGPLTIVFRVLLETNGLRL